MFFYSTSKKIQHTNNLKLHSLAEAKNESWLKTAVSWAEDKWGYLRFFHPVKHKDFIQKNIANFYILTYANQPIGMFALSDYQNFSKHKWTDLSYFYVAKNFRGLGIGGTMFKMAKSIYDGKNSDSMIIETLTPALNRFYEKKGAKVVGEREPHDFNPFPATIMRI